MQKIKAFFKRPFFYLFIILLCDQLTKYFIRSNFYLGESIDITSFFRLTYLTNTGVAFSMFQGANTFLTIVTSIIFIGLCLWYLKNKHSMTKFMQTALLLIISGAAGNLLDRVVFGYVIDFLDFNLGKYHWPAFNIADSCISVGGFILFFVVIIKSEKAEISKKCSLY